MTEPTCGVTSAFLKLLSQDYFQEASRDLYEDLIEPTEELLQRAQSTVVSPASAHLRCFYAVEHLYHHFVPATRPLPGRAQTLEDLAAQSAVLTGLRARRFARSHDGMTQLLSWLSGLDEEVELLSTVAELDGRIDGGLRHLQLNRLARWRKLLLATTDAATALRRSLNADHSPPTRLIGEALGRAFIDLNQTLESAHFTARSLLTITPSNAIHPWTTPTNSPE